MEEAIVGTEGDDDLRGTRGADVILGLGGDDELRGRRGDDVLRGGEGDDLISGKGGFDTVDYSDVGRGGGVVLDLRDPDRRGFVEALVDRDGDCAFEEVDRVEAPKADGVGVEAFRGGDGDDRFTGNRQDNLAIASGGYDRLTGGGGVDTVEFGEGSGRVELTLDPSTEDPSDLLIETSGGSDRAFAVISGFEAIVAGASGGGSIGSVRTQFDRSIEVDLGAERLVLKTGAGREETLALRVVNFDTVVGSRGDDTITGDDGDNIVYGTSGDDTLRGEGGFDELNYYNYYDADPLELPYPDFNVAGLWVGLGVATLIEEVEDDVFVSQDSFASFDVEAGTVDIFERVVGHGLPDVSDGAGPSSGEDLAPERKFTWVSTIDASEVAPGPVSVRIDLREGRVDATFTQDVGGVSAGDGFGFEALEFADAYGTEEADVILGDGESNTIEGGGGGDRLRGRGGDDRLIGGRGTDVIKGGTGDDVLFGGEGRDVLMGGTGDDVLIGGPGADTFRFTARQMTADADADGDRDLVTNLEARDLVVLAGERYTGRQVLDLAMEGTLVAGVEFDLDELSNEIVLRTDGTDAGDAIDADEVFANLRVDPGDFLG